MAESMGVPEMVMRSASIMMEVQEHRLHALAALDGAAVGSTLVGTLEGAAAVSGAVGLTHTSEGLHADAAAFSADAAALAAEAAAAAQAAYDAFMHGHPEGSRPPH